MSGKTPIRHALRPVSATRPPFHYERLDTSPPCIRLIELHTNFETEQITCDINTYPIEEAPAYEALSYCWGPRENQLEISLNESPFSVTENLYAALKQLRCITSMGVAGEMVQLPVRRRLWIDAICINQADLKERNEQVKLMWSIYSRASRVLVWLGEEDGDCTIGMEMVRLLAFRYEKTLREMISKLMKGEKEDETSTLAPGADPSTAVIEQKPNPMIQPVSEEVSSSVVASHDTSQSLSSLDLTSSGEVGRLSVKNNEAEDTPPDESSEAPQEPKGKGNLSFFYLPEYHSRTLSKEEFDELNARGRDDQVSEGFAVTSDEEACEIPFILLFAQNMKSKPKDPEEWLGLQKLFDRPWWHRMWVVQEIAAATDDQILVGCGSYWLKWETFLLASSCVEEYKSVPGLERLSHFTAGMKRVTDKTGLSMRKDGRLDGWHGLLPLLFFTAEYLASDPRDRIYALLGFVPSLRLDVDYAIGIETLYRAFVKTTIHFGGNLGMLLLKRHPKTLALPSWVPDFSLSLPETSFNIRCPLGFFGADGNNWHNLGTRSTGCTLNRTDKETELTVQGFEYDTVLVAGPVCTAASSERFHEVLDAFDEYERILRSTDSENFPDEQLCKHREEAFWRTLIWNADGSDRYPVARAYAKYFSELRTEKHYILPSDDSKLAKQKVSEETHKKYRAIPRGDASKYYDAFIRNGLNRRFFITSRGHLGSGPADMKAGDEVFVLLGLKSPAILRKVVPAGESDKYEWVGQTYVHGIMHGEALGLVEEKWDFQSRTKTMAFKDVCLV